MSDLIRPEEIRLDSYDLESHLIQPGLLMPPAVCGSTCPWSDKGADAARVLDVPAAFGWVTELLNGEGIIAGANIAYDLGIIANERPDLIPLIVQALDDDRIYDVQIAQALDAIANGWLFCEPGTQRPLKPPPGSKRARYSLATCVRLMTGREDAKRNDFWRKRYAILERVPMERWPWEAKQYPRDDAWNTVEVAALQLGLVPGRDALRNLEDQGSQARAAFALHLAASWGFKIDPERFEALKARTAPQVEAYRERYKARGFVREDGTQDKAAIKRAVAIAYAVTPEPCPHCGGAGKVAKRIPCRGPKVGRKYTGCVAQAGLDVPGSAATCPVCNGCQTIPHARDRVNCKACDGTGVDLDAHPAIPRSKKDGVKTDRDTLAESGDDDLDDFGDNEFMKVATAYIPALEEGDGGLPVCLSPNVLVSSGRVSYNGIWQTLPRTCAGCAIKRPDLCTCVRPCVRARDGRVLFSVDYSAGELVTLSQACLWVVGWSKMAEVINRTGDPGALHTALGAKMLGISEEEGFRRYAAKDAEMTRFRQAAKPFNFGAPGGMGTAKLVATNRKKNAGTTVGPDGRVYAGIRFCILVDGATECGTEKVTKWKGKPCDPTCRRCLLVADKLRGDWFEAWPEMREYFAWVSGNVDETGELPCFGPVDDEGKPTIKRIRGGLSFCDGANNGFQAMLADATKDALWQVTKEALTDKASALYTSETRTILMAHDELLGEMLAEFAHEGAHRVADIMKAALARYAPGVKNNAEPTIMRHWYKDAKPVYVDGRLVPWEPKK